MFTHRLMTTILLSSFILQACGDSTAGSHKPGPGEEFDSGMWFAGDPQRDWFIVNGSYEGGCLGEAGSPQSAFYTKPIYTFDGVRLAVELQKFEDSACSRPVFVRTVQGRPDLIQRLDGGNRSYMMYKDVGVTVHQVYLRARDVELLKRYDIPGPWEPERLNSILHLKEDEVRKKFEAIPAEAYSDSLRASGLMFLLFPITSNLVSMTVRNERSDLIVKSGPGVSQRSTEVRFKRRP
ncbi:MAG TPA: hypothetical protein VFO10_12965 [Oligoflexus sp.]|uniref:hypothetical protein n=1 Tax=Oligoflexus sp. TaxID=1971216 RepID=UPI002D7EBDF0|nr:hypothetical protein [Oligoflexus sp.]HET9238163.1 hypothetical protein [Oligoflexus sp.]